ncbi:hypothetical protein Y032_0535g3078 [Ancylostoma ceylanicum]|uniref:Uncharacterized protein n=1 Tax=Ancylostoma ceylanicum TaxID=53326 RepID=A0A016WRT1_9BILA|nr:hypothetical protein Y032_0535g3078 [Ancylostoma ceylanicum]
MFRSAVLLSFLFVLKTHYAAAAADASAGGSAAIPGIGNAAANIGAAIGGLPDVSCFAFDLLSATIFDVQVMGTVGNVVDTASGAANNLAGAAGGIAGQLPIAGPLLQQLLGTVLGLLGAVLGIAHQLPQPSASASMQAST